MDKNVIVLVAAVIVTVWIAAATGTLNTYPFKGINKETTPSKTEVPPPTLESTQKPLNPNDTTPKTSSPTSPTEKVQPDVVVTQTGGGSMLAAECANKSYIIENCEYIVEGTVVKVESRETEKGIFTYTDISVEKYVKGEELGEEIQIVTPGGRVGEIVQQTEDQPTFQEGMKVRLYLKATDGKLSIFCGQAGVDEIL